MSVTHLQDRGRDAFKSGDYATALEYYNRAIGRGNPTPQLLDQLASTHIRLKDLPTALQTAKKAIRAGPDDPTGYLRAGIVLKKMEKLDVALEVFAHGLKKIKHVGKGYEKLKQAHDELLKELAPNNSVDPLTKLPRELALAVLEYLDFRQRIAICRVSKGWSKFIQSEPRLWSHLDLSGARKKVKTSFISVAINKGRSQLTAATLNKLWDHDKVLKALVRSTSLTRLTLQETGLQGQNLADILCTARHLRELRILPGTEIDEPVLRQIVNALQGDLKVLQCAYVGSVDARLGTRWELILPKLETLTLKTWQILNISRFFEKLTSNAPELRSITIHYREGGKSIRWEGRGPIDLRKCTKLEHVDLSLFLTNAHALNLPPSVRELHLQAIEAGPATSEFFLGSEPVNADSESLRLVNLPRLKKLVSRMRSLSFHSLMNEFSVTAATADGSTELSDLSSLVVDHPTLPDFGIFEIGSRLSNLERLELLHTQALKDEHVDRILEQLKCLKALALSGTAITGVAIRSVVNCGHIKELIVNDCPNVSRDAVDLARSHGIKVEWKNTSQQASGGRKVRD